MKPLLILLGLAGAVGGLYFVTKPANADGGGNSGPKLVAQSDLVIS